ncbi:hypothetical protein TNCV_169141 [Trichonephila clavipes]|nr:hypothetical protein TNCV_169141 [Trichonephila clavipes]
MPAMIQYLDHWATSVLFAMRMTYNRLNDSLRWTAVGRLEANQSQVEVTSSSKGVSRYGIHFKHVALSPESEESKRIRQSDSRRVFTWRENGARFHPFYVSKIDIFGGKGIVCGDIMLGTRTPLNVYDAITVNLQRYKDEILEAYQKTFLRLAHLPGTPRNYISPALGKMEFVATNAYWHPHKQYSSSFYAPVYEVPVPSVEGNTRISVAAERIRVMPGIFQNAFRHQMFRLFAGHFPDRSGEKGAEQSVPSEVLHLSRMQEATVHRGRALCPGREQVHLQR